MYGTLLSLSGLLFVVVALSIAAGIHLRYLLSPNYSISYPLWDATWVLIYVVTISYLIRVRIEEKN